MKFRELRVLSDAFRNATTLGNQLANTWWNPTPLQANGELQKDQVAEAVWAEIWSPVTGPGVEEDLRRITLVADGHDLSSYISMSGIRSICMAPPKDRLWGCKMYAFGKPMSSNPKASTTIKYTSDLTIAALCGPGTYATAPITQNYRIRILGYVYNNDELPNIWPNGMVFPTSIVEPATKRIIPLRKDTIPVNPLTWIKLPGGYLQDAPSINPLIRYAYNLLATDGLGGDYQFRFNQQAVADQYENLYFDLDSKTIVVIQGLGVKAQGPLIAVADLARVGLRINGDYHPAGFTNQTNLFPTTPGINERDFGYATPFLPVPIYKSVPKLDQAYIINDEIGYVTIRDDALAAIPVNGVAVAVTGVIVEKNG